MLLGMSTHFFPVGKFLLGKLNALSEYNIRVKLTKAINLHASRWSIHY